MRTDFRPQSDLDMLVTFQAGEQWDLWDIVTMKEELQAMLGRAVDFVEKKALRNAIRRREILSNHEVIYAA